MESHDLQTEEQFINVNRSSLEKISQVISLLDNTLFIVSDIWLSFLIIFFIFIVGLKL